MVEPEPQEVKDPYLSMEELAEHAAKIHAGSKACVIAFTDKEGNTRYWRQGTVAGLHWLMSQMQARLLRDHPLVDDEDDEDDP